jgi:uncharacterized membrane protein YeaQ/YmgE (transglycosylase-associated protein family)
VNASLSAVKKISRVCISHRNKELYDIKYTKMIFLICTIIGITCTMWIKDKVRATLINIISSLAGALLFCWLFRFVNMTYATSETGIVVLAFLGSVSFLYLVTAFKKLTDENHSFKKNEIKYNAEVTGAVENIENISNLYESITDKIAKSSCFPQHNNELENNPEITVAKRHWEKN